MNLLEDLKELPIISNNSVLECLQARYLNGFTYTHAGKNIIISLNPCQLLRHQELKHSENQHEEKINMCDLDKVAEKCLTTAFTSFYESGIPKHQVFLITGESGAGKTENMKLLLKYFTQTRRISTEKTELKCLYEKACDSNPILESFGNAATCRNLNSSRFAKYVELTYNELKNLSSMNIRVFLLEKTRVLFLKDIASNESFHVFYQFQAAFINDYFQDDPVISTHFPSVFTSFPDDQTIENYLEGWHSLISALKTFNFFLKHSETELASILASMLLLCQLEFRESGRGDGDPPIVQLSESDNEKLAAVSELLGLSSNNGGSFGESELKSCLLQNRFNAGCGASQSRRDTCYVRPCGRTECSSRRDSLVKSIYHSLFNYLVEMMNDSSPLTQHVGIKIGMLDIFGFENLASNRFEQLCINYTNERLQQHFLNHFIEETKEEYRQEGIQLGSWPDIRMDNSVDNSPVIRLLTGPTGIFPTLNEECLLNRNKTSANATLTQNGCDSSDLNFLNRLEQSYDGDRLSVDVPRGEFLVEHFAGPICYSVGDFVKKNMDRLPQDMEEFILTSLYRDSTNSVLNSLKLNSLEAGVTKCGVNNSGIIRGTLQDRSNLMEVLSNRNSPLLPSTPNRLKKRNTVASWLKSAVDELLIDLSSYHVTYVRCIRPSNSREILFSSDYVGEQLAASGLKEAIDILRLTHPARFFYVEFIHRYGFLINLCHNTSNQKVSSAGEYDQIYFVLDRRYRKLHGLPDTPNKATPKSLRRKTGGSFNEHSFHQTGSIIGVCCYPWENSTYDSLPYLSRLGKSRVYLNEFELTRLETLRHHFLNSKCRFIQLCWRRYRQHTAATVIQKYYRQYRLHCLLTESGRIEHLEEPFGESNSLQEDKPSRHEMELASSINKCLNLENVLLIYPDVISIRRKPSAKRYHWRKLNPLNYLINRSYCSLNNSNNVSGLSDCLS